MPLSITSLKPYVPSKDFELSKWFYTARGFTPSEGWDGTADFLLNGHDFRLQNYYVQDWANNFMFVIGTWLFRVSNAYLLISLRTVCAPCWSTIRKIGNFPSARPRADEPRIAATGFGYCPQVETLPDSKEPDLPARVTVTRVSGACGVRDRQR